MSRPRHPQLIQARREAVAQVRQGQRQAEQRQQHRAAVPLPPREPAGSRGTRAALPKIAAARHPAQAPRPPRTTLHKPSARRSTPQRRLEPANRSSPHSQPPKRLVKAPRVEPPKVARRPPERNKPASRATTRSTQRPERRAPTETVRRLGLRPQHEASAHPPIARETGRPNRVARPLIGSIPDRARVVAPKRSVPPTALRRPSARAILAKTPGSARAATGLGWLSTAAGVLRDANGVAVRLLGLRSQGEAADIDLRDIETLLTNVAPGQRCVAVSMALTAQMKPAALMTLDARIARCAEAGIYTLLRIEARLWLREHHLRLARRYEQEPAVLFALIGRKPLATRLWTAAQALRATHARAVVWLPLESAQATLAAGASEGLGLLWDAMHPQHPHGAVLQGTLRQPVLIDGWLPAAHHPLAHDRLMSLCRQSGVGWLARSPEPWLRSERGVPVLSRAARVLQRAVHLSHFDSAAVP
jgi:hypothetical protein